MLKAAAFVSVIALGTFLVVTAGSDGEREPLDDDNSEGTLTPEKSNQTSQERGNNVDVTTPPDDHNYEGVLTTMPPETEKKRNNNNRAGVKESSDDGDSDGFSTSKAQSGNSQISRNNNKNEDDESASPDDGDYVKVSRTKAAPKRKSQSGGKRKGNKGNKDNLNEPTEGPVGHIMMSREATTDDEPTCSSPPEIGGAIGPRVEGDEHKVGTTVTYSCNFGYVSRNSINHISTCTLNETTGKAEWTKPELACIPRSCGDPGYVNNARRIGNLFTFPNKVEYECDEGYKIRGLRTRYCQAGGDWSGKLPICEQIYCTVPPDPANGRVRYSSLEYGAELKYECNSGFLLKKHERRFCAEDGSWSNDEPKCEEARCEDPQSPEHGTVRLSGDPKVGSLATYSCDPGTMLIGASTTKCLITGQWTFDPPKCTSFCNVPVVENGEMGRFETRRISKSRVIKEFKRFSTGTQVNPNATVLLRCRGDFLPTDDSYIFENNELEVTCNDGRWSKSFWCRQTSCQSEPPQIENGSPVVYYYNRRHGAQGIYYNCVSKKYKKVTGGISCQFGEWVGNAPKCLDSPCSTSQLNFPGLIKPEEELIATMRSFDIVCENGFTKATSAEEVTCISGKWNITQSPCIDHRCHTSQLHYPGLEKPSQEVFWSDEHFNVTCKNGYRKSPLKRIITCIEGKWDSLEDPCSGDHCYTSDLHYPGLQKPPQEEFRSDEYFNIICKNGFEKSTVKWIITCIEGKWNSTEDPCGGVILPETSISNEHEERPEPSNQRTGECNCTYGYLNHKVRATSKGKELQEGDAVRRGETVSFECTVDSRVLSWENGLRLSGKANMTCNKCQKWEKGDLPNCVYHQEGHPLIDYDDKLKIMPGGAAEIRNGVSVRLHCISTFVYPLWYFNGNPVGEQRSNYYGQVFYTFIDLIGTDEQHNGRYECKVVSRSDYRRGSSTLDLQVTEITCPMISVGNGLNVSYENSNKPGSWATFSCPRNTELTGDRHSVCQNNGTWSSSQPYCKYYVSCPRYSLSPGLEVSYSNDVSVGSTASFTCPFLNRLIGSPYAICQNDGTWNNPLPVCEEITCPMISLGNGLSVSYSNSNKPGSWATFSCHRNTQIIGVTQSVCQNNGTWSSSQPYCKLSNIRCPPIHGIGNFSIYYDNDRRINSTAQILCKGDGKRAEGCSVATCLPNGTWSGSYPECVDYVSCPRYLLSPGLAVSYSKGLSVGSNASFTCPSLNRLIGSSYAICQIDGTWNNPLPVCEEITCPMFSTDSVISVTYDNSNKRGSWATFTCSASAKLVGDTYARCENDGTWSKPQPYCEALPELRCSIGDLSSSVPEGIVPNMTSVTGEFMPPGSEMTLECENNLIPNGNSKAICGHNGRWEMGNLQCVPGCLLVKDPSSHLLVQPVKESYRLGEFILLSCPPGEEMTSDVERLMCLGKRWSDTIPDCKEAQEDNSRGT